MGVKVYEELQKIWGKITKDENLKDSGFDIQAQKKLLDVFQVGEYFYMIVNVRKSLLELVSPEIENVLGIEPGRVDVQTYVGLIHPDDLPYFLNFEIAVEEFFGRLSGDHIFKYKVQYDYRVKTSQGNYKRLLHQFVVIQHDENDVRTFVVDTDITHLKKEPTPMLSFIGMEGMPSYLNVDVKDIYRPGKNLFTKREKDILRALANGLNSTEISEKLRISKHTVDVHRKNILRKAEAKTTVEIVRLAFDRGWI